LQVSPIDLKGNLEAHAGKYEAQGVSGCLCFAWNGQSWVRGWLADLVSNITAIFEQNWRFSLQTAILQTTGRVD
jgi:hypothetical protein